MGYENDPTLHVRAGSGQLAVRLHYVRRDAVDIQRWTGSLPSGLVHRVARHTNPGDLRHPHGRQSVQKPPESRARTDGDWWCCGRSGTRRVAARNSAWVRAPATAVLWRAAAFDPYIHPCRAGAQAALLRGEWLDCMSSPKTKYE